MIDTLNLVEVNFFNREPELGLVVEKEFWENIESLKLINEAHKKSEFWLTLYILIDKKVHVLDFSNIIEFNSVIKKIS